MRARVAHRVAALGVAALVACNVDVELGRLPSADTGTSTGTSAGGDSSGTTAVSSPACGDAVVQAGEECDNAGDDADGCLASCEIATICARILAHAPDAADGVYTIDPDGVGPNAAFAAYCDMTADGGGWTLLAKVHRWHAEPNYDEPLAWFAAERDIASLLDPISYDDRLAASASHGAARIGPILADMSQARFTIIAEDDATQRATWFKAVDAGIWAWFSSGIHEPTWVCTDLAMTENCSTGRIHSDGEITYLEGMLMSHHGFTILDGGCALHMRHNGDGDGSFFASSLCSCTFNNDGNAWHDDAIDGHWGNGLEVWLR